MNEKQEKIGFWGIVSIGVGGMVGGGIFAVLGLSATLAGGATPLAFVIAGVVALLTAYSYAKLSVTYPDQGGTVIFLDRAFGINLLTGAMNTLLWVSYIVTLSLYTVAFANYSSTLFGLSDGALWKHILISGGILGPAVLNLASPSLVSKTEIYVVTIKVLILMVVIGFGMTSVEPTHLAVSSWTSPGMIVASGMIVFVAYEGFELMANATPDVEEYEKVMPRAYFSAVFFVIVLYVLTSIVTVGSLDTTTIQNSADFALAEAAKPSMGTVGFTLVAVAAILATFSAINATIYGSARLAYTIANEKEMPPFLKKKVWNQPLAGLVVTVVGALILSNTVDIEQISMAASSGFLIIFAMVNAANFRQSKQDILRKCIAGIGVLACIIALGVLVLYTLQHAPNQLWFLGGILLFVFVVEVFNMVFYAHHKT